MGLSVPSRPVGGPPNPWRSCSQNHPNRILVVWGVSAASSLRQAHQRRLGLSLPLFGWACRRDKVVWLSEAGDFCSFEENFQMGWVPPSGPPTVLLQRESRGHTMEGSQPFRMTQRLLSTVSFRFRPAVGRISSPTQRAKPKPKRSGTSRLLSACVSTDPTAPSGDVALGPQFGRSSAPAVSVLDKATGMA